MGQYFEIKINEAQLDAMLMQLKKVPKALPRVLRNAVNDTAFSARTQIVRQVKGVTKLKSETIRRRIPITKATLKNWRAFLRIKDSPLALTNFAARQTQKGVSYRDPLGGGRKIQDRAFIAKANNAENVWVRMKKGGISVDLGESLAGAELVKRLPIQRLVGPSVAEYYHNLSGLASAVISQATTRLHKNVQRHINLILGKKIIMKRGS
jgi:hypothetical protein